MIAQSLKKIFGGRLKENEPMARHTNFRLGGPARWFVEAREEVDVVIAMNWAHANRVPVFVMGGGSNTLVADKGFEGLVIQIAMRKQEIRGTEVYAEAGVMSAALARATAQAGLKGFEWAISLPGTIGGAVRGNAGCFGGETKDVAKSVRALRNDHVVELQPKDLQFDYRESAIKHNDDIVLSVIFQLEQGDAKILTATLDEILSKRKATQPLYAGSAGCIFKNPLDKNGNRVSAGKLIDEAGLKGTHVGGAQVSNEHGNFIINLGGATAANVRDLIHLVKKVVQEKTSIDLQEEVHYLGYED